MTEVPASQADRAPARSDGDMPSVDVDDDE